MKQVFSSKDANALVEFSPLATLLIGDDGSIRGCNAAFEKLVGQTWAQLCNDEQGVIRDGLLAPLLGTNTLVEWIMPDGNQCWLAIKTIELGEKTNGSVRFYEDVTETRRLKKERDELDTELARQSLKSAQLPGLLSRRGILVTMEPLVARSRRYNSPLSVIIMGLNGAQDIAIVRQTSFMLKDQTRWADLVGCNDQDEFMLVLQETTRDSAMQLVEKLTGQLSLEGAENGSALTACYGVTDCQKNDNAETLLERAEAALGEARKNQSGTAIAV